MKLEFELDHIGIAVETLEKGFEFYKALGFEQMQTEEVASEKVKTGFLKLGNDSSLELLEPTSADSVIAKYLQKRGPGIHHICLRVPNIEKSLAQLKAAGVRLLNETPKKGAHDCLVAFVHPASTGGVLIELSQPPGRHP